MNSRAIYQPSCLLRAAFHKARPFQDSDQMARAAIRTPNQGVSASCMIGSMGFPSCIEVSI